MAVVESFRTYSRRDAIRFLLECVPAGVALTIPLLQGRDQISPSIRIVSNPQAEAAKPVGQNSFLQLEDTALNVIPKETPVPRLRLNLVPHRLSLPQRNIENIEVLPRSIDKSNVLLIPDKGIATANDAEAGYGINNIWIYGHSLWNSIPQIFYALQDVNLEEKLIIDCDDLTRKRQFQSLEFTVDQILLGDKATSSQKLLSQRPNFPRLILQTSVRESGLTAGSAKKWILDREKIKSKAQSMVEGDENDPAKYLLLFVIGKPTPETLARLRSNQ